VLNFNLIEAELIFAGAGFNNELLCQCFRESVFAEGCNKEQELSDFDLVVVKEADNTVLEYVNEFSFGHFIEYFVGVFVIDIKRESGFE
jgi:hypothetical protein